MMSDLRAAAQQALEALRGYRREMQDSRACDAEQALEAALAQQEEHAEPVLVVEKEPDYTSRGHFHEGSKPWIDPVKVWALPVGTKLYTAPPQRKPLTDEQIREGLHQLPSEDACAWSFRRGVEFAQRAHGIGGEE